MFEEFANHDIAAFAGYVDDVDELLQCTSGGLATAMSKKMIEEGGYVAGVRYSDDFKRAYYDIVSDIKALDNFKGSKYIEVEKGTIYRDVKSLLDEGKKVLFFGLPCMVGAMKSFLKNDYDNFIAVELICHGPTSAKVHQQYVDYLENKYQSKIVDFSVRKKIEKWKPAYLYAKFENGQIFSKPFYSTEYGYAFSVMSGPSCYNCQFRGDSRVGDIMIGDFWGATEKDTFWNSAGVSAILVHSDKGLDFLKNTGGIKIFETSFERIVTGNRNIISTRKPSSNKEKFEKLFAEKDLFYAAKRSKGFKGRMKDIIVSLVPNQMKPLAKKIYHTIKNK